MRAKAGKSANSLAVLAVALFLLVLSPGPARAAALPVPTSEPPGLTDGYRLMYDLDFDRAHQAFGDWKTANPDNPLGPVSNAAAYLFSEFERLRVLDIELFTNDERFRRRTRLTPDPAVKAKLDRELQKTDQLVNQVLARSPNDPDAMLAEILANGLRGDYAAMIEKRNMAGLKYMKASRAMAQRLLRVAPTYYDAYLAIGAENYLLGLKPMPVRWILRLGGAQTDKDMGVDRLRITAAKGRYLAPYARLLLAVAALRDDDRATAAKLLGQLAEEFPDNRLIKEELARIRD